MPSGNLAGIRRRSAALRLGVRCIAIPERGALRLHFSALLLVGVVRVGAYLMQRGAQRGVTANGETRVLDGAVNFKFRINYESRGSSWIP